MRISLDTLWSGLGVLAGSSLLNTNVLNVKLRGNFPSTTDQIKFQFWRAFEFTLDFQQRNFLHYIAGDAALWNPGKYIPKVMLRVVGEEGSPLRGWRRRKWKLFFRKFSRLALEHFFAYDEERIRRRVKRRKARSVCGKIWGLEGRGVNLTLWDCENVRRKCPFCRFPGNPRHWSSRGLDMSVSLCISHIYHQPSVAAMNRSCNNLGKTEKSIHSSQSRVAIRGKLFSQAPGWGAGLPQAMAPGKRDALDFTVRAALSLIIITTSYAVAESKYSILFSAKLEIYANLRIMKFDLGKVTFFENWNRFTKWKVTCAQKDLLSIFCQKKDNETLNGKCSFVNIYNLVHCCRASVRRHIFFRIAPILPITTTTTTTPCWTTQP